MKNRDGWQVEVTNIGSLTKDKTGYFFTKTDGWTIWVSNEECAGFVPQVGDVMVVYTQGFSRVKGIVIDGNVLRYTTKEQAEVERAEWLNDLERKREEEYQANKDVWQAQVAKLHPTLINRIRRFEFEKGAHAFWTDGGPYEMYAMNGATALINAAEFYHPGDNERQVKFLKDWWSINEASGGYDYKGQLAMVPEFGDGHSGNTAGLSYSFAKAILSGEYVE